MTVLAWSFVTTSAVIPVRVVAQRPASLLRMLPGCVSSAGPRLQEGLASFRPCSLPTLPAVCRVIRPAISAAKGPRQPPQPVSPGTERAADEAFLDSSRCTRPALKPNAPQSLGSISKNQRSSEAARLVEFHENKSRDDIAEKWLMGAPAVYQGHSQKMAPFVHYCIHSYMILS